MFVLLINPIAIITFLFQQRKTVKPQKYIHIKLLSILCSVPLKQRKNLNNTRKSYDREYNPSFASPVEYKNYTRQGFYFSWGVSELSFCKRSWQNANQWSHSSIIIMMVQSKIDKGLNFLLSCLHCVSETKRMHKTLQTQPGLLNNNICVDYYYSKSNKLTNDECEYQDKPIMVFMVGTIIFQKCTWNFYY